MRSAIRDQSPKSTAPNRTTPIPGSIGTNMGANVSAGFSNYAMTWLGKRALVMFEVFGYVTSAQMNGRFVFTGGGFTVDTGYGLILANGQMGVHMWGPGLLGTPPAGPGLVSCNFYMNNSPGAWMNYGHFRVTIIEDT